MKINSSHLGFGKRMTAKTAIRAGVAVIAVSVGATWCVLAANNTGPGVNPSKNATATQERTATVSSQPVGKDSDAFEKMSAAAGMPRPMTNPTFSGQPFVPTSAPYNTGDVFVGVGNGFIKHFSPSGVLLDTLNTGTGCGEDTGMAFTSTSHLLATTFGCGVVEFDNMGNLIGPFGSGYNTDTESVVIDGAGNVYIGQADGTKALKKFNSAGTFLMDFFPATQNRGTDWNDLAADLCTMFYTSEGNAIKRFNVCTNTQLSDFATSSASPKFALRIRSNGEVLVAASSVLERYDASGTLIQTYTFPGTLAFAINLDPDGTHFWTADLVTGTVYKYDISTGTIVLSFSSMPNTTAAGLAVFGEPIVAQSPTPAPSATATATATATPTPTPTPTPRPSPTPTATPVAQEAYVTSSGNVKKGKNAAFIVALDPGPAVVPVTVFYSMSGSARLGTDYTLSGTPGQVTIPAGQSSANVILHALRNVKKNATMTLTPGPGYFLSGLADDVATIKIKKK